LRRLFVPPDFRHIDHGDEINQSLTRLQRLQWPQIPVLPKRPQPFEWP
jgi:hypothetical protein